MYINQSRERCYEQVVSFQNVSNCMWHMIPMATKYKVRNQIRHTGLYDLLNTHKNEPYYKKLLLTKWGWTILVKNKFKWKNMKLKCFNNPNNEWD